jgi:hypothetical protein
MTQDMQADWPVRQLMVHRAENLRVVHGVNEGEPLADAAELLPEDVYELSDDARARPLALAQVPGGAFTVGARTNAGTPGAKICLDSLVTFMSADGSTVEALILVELEPGTDLIAAVHVHPFTPMMPKVPYTLVTIDRDGARARLAESATVSFTRGTRITMADGRQVPVEDLAPGDRVLTRDSGPQEVRWTGMQTVRAEGDFAPVRIRAGALHNMGDLVVSPNHRLFIYQRISALGAGQRDLLVRAGLLVNGTSVTRTPGGFVDYVQVLFDHHEIIYAEGIAAESLFADPATRGALPDAIARELDARPLRDAVEGAFELRESDLLARGDAVEVLRRISAN